MATPPGPFHHQTQQRVANLAELLALPPEQRAEVDIAEMNLHCAEGLPGAENLDIDACLAMLDRWAERVRTETERHLYRAADPRWADHYRHSEAYLRAEFVLQVLQQDLDVHYNMERVENIDFTDSRDLFVHGLVGSGNGGTCVSMPVAYVAVGRRLGYPMKLVLTKAHLFARWDGLGDGNPAWRERFNIEGAGDGFSSFDDEYYRTWPQEWTEPEIEAGHYLRSLTPAGELANFLASRGHCLLDIGRFEEAAEAYAKAASLDPADPSYAAWASQARRRLAAGERAAGPASDE